MNLFSNIKTGSVVFLILLQFTVLAQGGGLQSDDKIYELNTITTSVPFLRIAPDARSSAMGDVGIALEPDASSIYWNPSKIVFAEKKLALAVSYTPWLRELVNDIYLAYLSGYIKLDDKQALGLSLLYFDLGDIQFTDNNGESLGEGMPHEFGVEVAYARKLSDRFSIGLGLKFIYSNLAAGQTVSGIDIRAGKSIAADISGYWEKDIKISNKDSRFSWGYNISNVGSKITYTESADKDFIPINLGLGAALKIAFDDYNELTFGIDINKLLVPSPNDSIDANGDGRPDYKDKSIVSGMFGSFSDAPGGFGEEIHELMFSIGAEYWYAKQFAVRGGYFYEHGTKGNRKYITAGLGLKFNVFGLSVSYLIPTNSQRNPLDNTLRFTLSFDFDSFKGEKKNNNNSK